MNSREKGKRGEREWAAFLCKHGIKARRGRQFSGGPESPDVVSDLPIHWEVKRGETLNVYAAMYQAFTENKVATKYPAVAHRRNNKTWLVTMRAGDFLALLSSATRHGILAYPDTRSEERRQKDDEIIEAIKKEFPPAEGGDGR